MEQTRSKEPARVSEYCSYFAVLHADGINVLFV